MKKWSATFVCFMLISSQAWAGLIEYGFSGSITRMFEHDGASETNTDVNSSNMFGLGIGVGDSFSGSFRYDADATESDYRIDNPDSNSAVFQNAVLDFRFEVGDYVYVDQSPGGILDSLVLKNNSDLPHQDSFSVLSSNALDEYYSNSSMGFFNSDGDAFNDFALPTSLNLNDFIGYGFFHSALLDRDSGDQLHFYGHASKLVAKVSEPGTIILLSIGLFGIVGRFALPNLRRSRAF
tara:strand:- start:5845 stop:6555 length:711 start_codon:yes stop_codon:yes gene_type:complete